MKKPGFVIALIPENLWCVGFTVIMFSIVLTSGHETTGGQDTIQAGLFLAYGRKDRALNLLHAYYIWFRSSTSIVTRVRLAGRGIVPYHLLVPYAAHLAGLLGR